MCGMSAVSLGMCAVSFVFQTLHSDLMLHTHDAAEREPGASLTNVLGLVCRRQVVAVAYLPLLPGHQLTHGLCWLCSMHHGMDRHSICTWREFVTDAQVDKTCDEQPTAEF